MINKKLKARIVEQYLSQIDFADVVGVNDVLISKVIRGHRTLSETEKSRWAETLECKPVEIFRD